MMSMPENQMLCSARSVSIIASIPLWSQPPRHAAVMESQGRPRRSGQQQPHAFPQTSVTATAHSPGKTLLGISKP